MNKRERVLLFTLLGLVIFVGGWAMYYFFYRQPMETLYQRLTTANADVENRKRELETAHKEEENIFQHDPRLRFWQKISLPEAKLQPGQAKTPDNQISRVQGQYARSLGAMLSANGFDSTTLTIAPRQADSKSSPTLPGKGPIYTKFQFAVQGQASLEALVKTLEQFHRDNLLQQVHQLIITKPTGTVRPGANPTDLEVKLTVEALLVNGAEARDELKPTFSDKTPPPVLAPYRNYNDIWMVKNIFLGNKSVKDLTLTEDKNQVLSAVRLTTVSNNGRRWEAYLYDQGKGGDERLLTVIAKPDFTIVDKYDNEVLKGKVVLIDDHLFVFQANGNYYRMTAGDFFYAALEKPLKDDQIKELGLTPRAAPAANSAKSTLLTAPVTPPQ